MVGIKILDFRFVALKMNECTNSVRVKDSKVERRVQRYVQMGIVKSYDNA